ncbi:putative oxidoreductase [Vibrio halioticoli NBRC 102217]|uniref:Putative oxidoreductase n=1 Tax=Vibrio halioticoli NBRC 102217 TaxID=1219072 RepID=V5HIW0_9VIBR|nr:SDR family oxidoreductase [Vibrio halioticoli]GAD89260.1 putative oxidoreductase [Vibrio halioticoli NBRC 102217]
MTTKQFGPKGWTPELMPSLKGKTYLITGANTGAGFEASRILLSKGAKVVMLNRNPNKSKTAIEALKTQLGANAEVSFITLDLSKLDSVRKAATQILNSIPQIDALICNGAIAQVAKQEFTADGFESQLGVNHYGHFLLCGMLFERIDASQGRIVVVGSEGYKMGIKKIQFDDMNWDNNYHPNNTYCHSKLAQMMFGYELQNRIKQANKNVQVYVCHPGASKTSLINNKANGITRIAFSLMAMTPIVQSAEKGAYPELMCATQANLSEQAYYGPTGFNYWVGPVDQRQIESFVKDKASAQRLWALSEQETGVQFPL